MSSKGKSQRGSETIQVWSYEQVQTALPYIGSVMRSLREHQLEASRFALQVRRFNERHGRPDRSLIIALAEAQAGQQQAEARYREAEAELHALDVYCGDALNGLALIPFAREDRLAWFVYEAFEEEPIRYWRFHEDKPGTQRPMSDILKDQRHDAVA